MAIVAGAVALSSFGQAAGVQAQPASRYPTAAPVEQYRLKSRGDEIALARSAGPPSISAAAEVLVLGEHGYETAVKGTNGYVCFVQRSWAGSFDDPEFWNPTTRAPNCFNPTAVRTELVHHLKRAEWVMSGVSKQDMIDRTRSAYANHTFKTPEPGAFTYMLSKGFSDAAGSHWLPHLMFFVPFSQEAAWGTCADDSPIICHHGSEMETTLLLVPVRRWSDGSPGPVVVAQHTHSND